MTGRLNNVYSLPSNIYSKGCPIVISAGALYTDAESGKVLAQLKLKNISDKTIASCKVSIKAFENNGDELPGVEGFSYLDLSVNPGDEFGSRIPVFMPDQTTRSIEAIVEEVVYCDKSVEKFEKQKWKQIPTQNTVAETMNNPSIIEQIMIDYGSGIDYMPLKKNGLFLCSCGAVNLESNSTCYKCGRSYDELTQIIDIENLQERLTKREAEEEAARLESERKAEERRLAAEATAKRTKKILRKVIPIVVGVSIFVILLTNVIIPKVIVPANKYKSAVALLEEEKYDDAIATFDELGDYKDSKKQLEIAKEARIESIYNTAQQLYNSGKYREAISEYEKISTYKDSSDQIVLCSYNEASKLIDSEEYESAAGYLEKIDYKDSKEKLSLCKYETAKKQIQLKEYEAAYKLLDGLNYKDSNDLLKTIKPKYDKYVLIKPFLSASAGDVVTFGTYDQDGNKKNGNETIQWQVLEHKDNNILLISKKALEYSNLNDSRWDATWEKCDMRVWLNGDFLNNSFDSGEQDVIKQTNVSADNNPNYKVNPGNATNDKVFFLSISEVEKYFTSASDRKCDPVDKILSEWEDPDDSMKYFDWWLRTPGDNNGSSVACVEAKDGSIDYEGKAGNTNHSGVRPAMWLDLSIE